MKKIGDIGKFQSMCLPNAENKPSANQRPQILQ